MASRSMRSSSGMSSAGVRLLVKRESESLNDEAVSKRSGYDRTYVCC